MNSLTTKTEPRITQHGFTMIEFIIYLAIIGLTVVAFVTFAITISNNRNKTFTIHEVQSSGRAALITMSSTIRQATGVNIGASTFGSDPGVLSLSYASASLNPTVIDLTADDGQIRLKQGASSPVMITSNDVSVTNLVFTNLSGSNNRENIRIQFTIEFTDAGDRSFVASRSFQTSISTRQ